MAAKDKKVLENRFFWWD